MRGLGIDERTAVLLSPDGTASVVGEGAAWLLRMRVADVRACVAGRPLETLPIDAVAVPGGASFDLASWTGAGERYAIAAAEGSVLQEPGYCGRTTPSRGQQSGGRTPYARGAGPGSAGS